MKSLALLAIRCYQRWLSPRKGWRCAYAVHMGRCGCSGLGYRAIRRYGVMGGSIVLSWRLAECRRLHRLHLPSRPRLHRQAGVCDIGVDAGLFGAGWDGSTVVEGVGSCVPCDCGWGIGAERPVRAGGGKSQSSDDAPDAIDSETARPSLR